MEPVNISRGTTGLNTVDPSVRLSLDKQGMSDVAQATNISIDPSNRPRRRIGYTTTEAGNFHSMFCDRHDCYVAKDTASYCSIMRVNPDGTTIGVRSHLARFQRISWAQSHDAPFQLFYANGFQNGVITNGISDPWPDQSNLTRMDTDHRFISPAPVGYLIAIVHGRMLVATHEGLYYSEPFAFGAFDLGGNYLPWNKVTMIKEVKGGVFISTDKEILFYAGQDIATAEVSTVSPFPALPGSCAIDYVEGFEVGLQAPGLCALWVTREGACLGTPLGEVININKKKVVYPEDVSQGASLLRGYNFIQCMS